MKIQTTVFLAFLLTALGIYYWVSGTGPDLTSSETVSKVLAFAEGDALTHLKIENKGSREILILERKPSTWKLVSPVESPAENFIVEGMIQALVFSRREKPFPAPRQETKSFGLEDPELRISVRTEKAPGEKTLLLGNETPVPGRIYARWQGEGEVFLVPALLKASFQKTAYSLRQKFLFRADWEKVEWIFVRMGEKKYHLVKKSGQWRWVVPPVAKDVPAEKIQDLLYSFQSLYVKEFLDGVSPEESDFALKQPGTILTLGWGEDRQEKVLLGAAARGKDALYGMRADEDLVLLVSETHIKDLLQLFDVLFQETAGNVSPVKGKNVDTGKNSGSTGTNPPVGAKGAPGPVVH